MDFHQVRSCLFRARDHTFVLHHVYCIVLCVCVCVHWFIVAPGTNHHEEDLVNHHCMIHFQSQSMLTLCYNILPVLYMYVPYSATLV